MVRVRTESRFPACGGSYSIATGCDLEESSSADRGAAFRKVAATLVPPAVEQAEGWLVMLQASCARRVESEAFNAAAFAVYSGALMRFPADVARAACYELARGKGGVTWFPTLGELMDVCERMAAPRQVILAALERRPVPNRDASAISEQERQKVATGLRTLAGQMAEESPKPKPYQFHQSPTDAAGVTPELRAWLAKTEDTRP